MNQAVLLGAGDPAAGESHVSHPVSLPVERTPEPVLAVAKVGLSLALPTSQD
jgi:hypothetical protein